MFSLAVELSRRKIENPRHGNLSNHMNAVSLRVHLLSLGYRYSKSPPPDCSCSFQLHLTCREDFGLQKALLRNTFNHEGNALHCRH